MSEHTADNTIHADIDAEHHAAWGAPPSERYEALARDWRPLFTRIRASAVERDIAHRLPHEEIKWLREAGFTRLRLPREQGGVAATLPELFGLLIELGAADTNVVNAVRAHLGFVEDVLTAHEAEWQAHWLGKLSAGELIGAGLSEAGSAKVGTFATTITRTPQGIRLNGRKFYTTGSLFADWVAVAAQDGENTVYLQVPRATPGVEVIDDWDGFGQALTASGTATFVDVAVDPDWIRPSDTRFPYAVAFYQLVHLASLAGIGRALADDVARRVRRRDRVYSNGNAGRVADDPQILQVVGRLHSAAYAARAVVLQAAKAIQRSYEAHQDAAAASESRRQEVLSQAVVQAHADAHIEVDQSVSVITRLVLDASTDLFDALGASATLRTEGLDRYWRNARTISSHNPRVYRERQVGAFAVNGTVPPSFYRVGKG
ncbi:alkylation response protein AidB-like acyl-CoA dehydrogenase [Paraburkholderia unamae]|uniref:acyl-CoA dehydrogenase family protein n=1 Tax=Paraburkholderia unamae TaxID=219649 RepID=UPI000DC33856|nr:acyl-CoA dehydrogenase family protein [Paraburkholderia unamae]RAR62606.1 alkylation response protein AidB-like acyl-CoA dehydrogenase [Paraburkholderia unamae]